MYFHYSDIAMEMFAILSSWLQAFDEVNKEKNICQLRHSALV